MTAVISHSFSVIVTLKVWADRVWAVSLGCLIEWQTCRRRGRVKGATTELAYVCRWRLGFDGMDGVLSLNLLLSGDSTK